MKRQEDHPLTKHTLNLYQGDFDWFGEHYSRLGASKAIRDLVRAHRRQEEEKVEQVVGDALQGEPR